MALIEAFIKGIPQAQARHRTGQGRHYVRRSAWRDHIAWNARQFRPNPPLQSACRVDMDWYMPRPKAARWKIYCDVKPDIDNLEKETLDAFSDAGWWIGDQVVVSVNKNQFYETSITPPGLRLKVWTLTNDNRRARRHND